MSKKSKYILQMLTPIVGNELQHRFEIKDDVEYHKSYGFFSKEDLLKTLAMYAQSMKDVFISTTIVDYRWLYLFMPDSLVIKLIKKKALVDALYIIQSDWNFIDNDLNPIKKNLYDLLYIINLYSDRSEELCIEYLENSLSQKKYENPKLFKVIKSIKNKNNGKKS